MAGAWAAIPFAISLVLLGAFIGFRSWEERRGARFFSAARERLDEAVSAWYHGLVTGDIPQQYRTAVISFAHQLSHAVVVLAVQGLRAIEKPLMRLSYRMRRGAPSSNGKGPSEFLKTIRPERKGTGGESTSDSVS